jgi:hypothetical protein
MGVFAKGNAIDVREATVKATPVLWTPLTVTTTLPVEAPLGTLTVMLLAPQHPLQGVATVPLKLTVLFPWVAPKFPPEIVTDAPTPPDAGDSPLMLGVGTTVNPTALLGTPLEVTTTFPVVALLGTGVTILVLLQLVGLAAHPLKVIEFPLDEEPRFVPVIVTKEPVGPNEGVRLAMLGVGSTVKLMPLLFTPLA